MSVPRHRSLAARLALRRLGWADDPVAEPPAPLATPEPAPVPEVPPPKPSAFEQLERVAKAVAVLLGALYVVGLLVSNAQLLRLGISDFSLLQAKSIATGLVFMLYLVCLTALLAPPLALVAHFAMRFDADDVLGPTSWPLVLLAVVLALFAEAAVAMLVGAFYGAMLPWGVSMDMDAPFWPIGESLRYSWVRITTIWATLKDLFFHAWIIFLMLGLVFPVLVAVDMLLRSWRRKLRHRRYEDDDEDSLTYGGLAGMLFSRSGRLQLAMLLFYAGAALPYGIVGFSRDIYPNIVQSMGGGQPHVVQIQPTAERLTTFGGIDTCCYPTRPDPVVLSEPLVVWHESDKFLYVTPLPKPGQPMPRSLVAIDIRAVRAIQYQPKVVRVGGGDRILEVRDEPVDK